MKTTKTVSVKDAMYSAEVEIQTNKESSFNLKDASFCGGEALVLNPRDWSQLEDAHIAAGLNSDSNCHYAKAGIQNRGHRFPPSRE